ncbi:MAG: M1 family peptidase [Dehalococcoidia bacterium]|nr:M1 family peptidase [Dehalococcoidia bacterium]
MATTARAAQKAPRQNLFRLSTNVKPEKYRLTLTPDLGKFSFSGEVAIDVTVAKATNQVVVNVAELTIQEVRVILPSGVPYRATNVSVDETSERATFTFGITIPEGEATIMVRYTGILNDQLRGFYRSRYSGVDGRERYLATTQFEATDARRAFPCWDEPNFKATFQLTLVIPIQMTAISNTLVLREAPTIGVGLKAITFEETPKMSTYLLAFVVGDMACVQATMPNGTLVRVWATRGKEEQGRYALENSVKILTYMNEYFGIPYPLKKLDHVAIPDFAAGAMENWGCITYRETALLFDPKNSAAAARQRILEVVAHETAHMWFGDLVTMAWWDDLWLNESFASWMGDKAVDHIHPEWDMWTQFIYADTNAGMSLDSLRNSHTIEANVKDPNEIRELFDAISYSKGGSVLRMLEEFLGAEMFRKGLHNYLDAHKYDNAQTADLWSALDEASQMPVTKVMDSWVKQVGFPLVNVKMARRASGVAVTMTQQRFLYDNLLGGKVDKTLWQIPVNVVRAKTPAKASTLLDKREETISLGKAAVVQDKDWIKVNAAQTGFYRVQYQPAEMDRLRAAVQAMQLPPTDRLGLQNDAYALARGGFQPATEFLKLVQSYKKETDVSVWRDLSAGLRGMESIIAEEPYVDKFRRSAGSLFKDVVKRVGWDGKKGEGHMDVLLRGTVLGQIGYYGDKAMTAEARARFAKFLKRPASLHPDLRGVVYGIVAQEGDRKTYDLLWKLEREATVQEEKLRLLGALGRFKDPVLLQDLLQRAMDTNEVRIQDTVGVIRNVGSNDLAGGRDLAWEFVKKNWGELDRRYGKGGFAITALVGVTGSFTAEAKAKEVRDFFKTHPAPSAARTIQQSLERISLNAKWLEKNKRTLKAFFTK